MGVFYLDPYKKIGGSSSFAQDLAKRIIDELPQFPKINERLRIYSDTDKYNYKEDESVWNQQQGRSPEEGEIYLDREFVCFYTTKDGINKALVRFLTEIGRLYLEGKIFVHPEMYAIKEEEERSIRDKQVLEIPEARNEVEQIIVDNIKEQAKKRKVRTKTV